MKMIGKYTARGIITEADTEAGNPQRITLFDGSFKTAYRVTEFYIWAANYDNNSATDVIGKLSKNEIGVTAAASFMRADDDNQIAWAGIAGSSDSINAPEFTLVDPDNLVVEDLFVYARTQSTNTNPINYMVVMEKYEITDWQGALAMARDRAQGDL
jgi:hypothetical protein